MIATPTAARLRAIEWAQEVVADPASVFLDTETTGLGEMAEICDIAIVGVDGRVLFDSLILPLGDIPEAASQVHGITIGMLDRAKAPMWKDVYQRIAAVLSARRVVVYNADFDATMINQATYPARFPALYLDWQCALGAFADYNGSMTSRRVQRGNRWVWERGPKWHKLSEACAAMGVVLDGAHRALADAEATRRLVIAMAATCPLDVPDAYQPDGRCCGCGGDWIMGRHFHPDEIAMEETGL